VACFRGGYHVLAIDLEGTRSADWLTLGGSRVVLKYRVPFSRKKKNGPYLDRNSSAMYSKAPSRGLCAETVGLVRFHAASASSAQDCVLWFSERASGAAMSTHFEQPPTPFVPASMRPDKESSRPDFAMAVFTGHLWIEEEKKFEFNHGYANHLPAKRRLRFVLQPDDDHVDEVNDPLVTTIALRRWVPVEMHFVCVRRIAVWAARRISDNGMPH